MKFCYAKETKEITISEVARIQDQITELKPTSPTVFPGNFQFCMT